MGGYGSGKKSDRETVDEALALDVNNLIRKRLLSKSGQFSGLLTWTYSSTGEEVASCIYGYDTMQEPLKIYLQYTYNQTEDISCTIYLDAIPVHLGGKRLYLICPQCGRRAWYLYLNPYVKCRICHDLTYVSCKESHKHDGLYAWMAAGSKFTMEDFRRTTKDCIREARKERERKERLSRRGRKKRNPYPMT